MRRPWNKDWCRHFWMLAFGKLYYVANLCALPAAQLKAWNERFMGHPDAICCGKAILVSHFPCEVRTLLVYWNTHVRAEPRALQALGHFVPYHLMCVFNIMKAASYWCLVCIPVAYNALQACHGFKSEQESVFSYKFRAMILNPESVLCVMAYTERELQLCAAVSTAVYAEHRVCMWHQTSTHLPPRSAWVCPLLLTHTGTFSWVCNCSKKPSRHDFSNHLHLWGNARLGPQLITLGSPLRAVVPCNMTLAAPEYWRGGRSIAGCGVAHRVKRCKRGLGKRGRWYTTNVAWQ